MDHLLWDRRRQGRPLCQRRRQVHQAYLASDLHKAVDHKLQTVHSHAMTPNACHHDLELATSPAPFSMDVYSVYLAELPLHTRGSYFAPFFSIFCSTAAAKSMSHTSASLTRYNSTSLISSPTWICGMHTPSVTLGQDQRQPAGHGRTFSAALKSGRPRATSPFHWKISASSPTSPVRASRILRGVWN